MCYWNLEENTDYVRVNLALKHVIECYVTYDEKVLMVKLFDKNRKFLEFWNLKTKVKIDRIEMKADTCPCMVSHTPQFILF